MLTNDVISFEQWALKCTSISQKSKSKMRLYVLCKISIPCSGSKDTAGGQFKGLQGYFLYTVYFHILHLFFSDFLKWQKCQALLKFKKQERECLQEQGEEQCSSDEV